MAQYVTSSGSSIYAGIEAPPHVSALSSGSDIGALVGDVWTPGRDGNGVVTRQSFNIVPLRRWIRVANTRLDSLDAIVKAQIPGWNDFGSNDWDGVLNAYNSFAVNQVHSEAYLVTAGGHLASSNNGIYKFSGLTMQWSVVDFPSDTAPWDNRYRNLTDAISYTTCNASAELRNTDIANGVHNVIGGRFYDELIWDRKPTSRHTYDATLYIPETNELVIMVRRLWRFQLNSTRTSGSYTYRREFPQAVDGAGLWATWDEVAGRILWGGNADAFRVTLAYRLATNQWESFNGTPTDYSMNSTRHDRIWAFADAPDTSTLGRFIVYDLNSQTLVRNQPFTLVGCSLSDFTNQDDGTSLVYVPPINRYWACMNTTAGHRWFDIDVSNSNQTLLRPRGFVNAGPAAIPLPMRKCIWFPQLKCLFAAFKSDENVHIMRF